VAHSYTAKEIMILARMYEEIHAEELAAAAMQMIQRSAELKKMYEKAQRLRPGC
jgi:hypothetical protein